MVQLLPLRGGQAHVRQLGPPHLADHLQMGQTPPSRKNRRWVVNHYYGVDQGRGWDLWDGRNRLPRHNETRVSRFVKVRGKASPFDRACATTGRIAAHGGWCAKPVTSIASTCATAGGPVRGLQSGLRSGPRAGRQSNSWCAATATGEMTRALVHRWCRPGRPRGRPCMRWPMLEPYAGKPARTVLRGLGGSQGLPGYPTLSSNPRRRPFNAYEPHKLRWMLPRESWS